MPTFVKVESRKYAEPMLPFWSVGSVGLVVSPFLSSGRRRKPMSAFLTVMDFQVCVEGMESVSRRERGKRVRYGNVPSPSPR